MTGLDITVACLITSILLNIYFFRLYRNADYELQFSKAWNEVYRETLGILANRRIDNDK